MRKAFKIYQSYVNDFITLQGCAAYYGISLNSMRRIYSYYHFKNDLTFSELAKL